ncbi:hypothetical protein GCM10027418_13490 [Mariniluteicoccus endophyticus]
MRDRLVHECDRLTGFLAQLREGRVDPTGAERFLGLLSSLDLGDGPVDRKLVQFLWFTPVFLQWQVDRHRLTGDGSDHVSQLLDKVVTALEEVVGPTPSEFDAHAGEPTRS